MDWCGIYSPHFLYPCSKCGHIKRRCLEQVLMPHKSSTRFHTPVKKRIESKSHIWPYEPRCFIIRFMAGALPMLLLLDKGYWWQPSLCYDVHPFNVTHAQTPARIYRWLLWSDFPIMWVSLYLTINLIYTIYGNILPCVITAVDVPQGVCYGQTDVPLKPTFRNGGNSNAAAHLQGLSFDKVYTSPLTRCSATFAATRMQNRTTA